MAIALRIISILLGAIALSCSFTWLIALTLVAGPLGIVCWYVARQLEKTQTNISPFSRALGWIAIILNGLGLLISLVFVVLINIR